MALYCPQCSRSYEDEVQCPRCAVTLSSEPVREDPDDPLPPHWTRNPWGRTLLGVLLAQGLFFVIHEFALAGVFAASEGLTGTWANLSDLLTVQAFQVAALLVGAVLAGAGQKNGAVYGSFVGVWNGILSVLFQSISGEQITAVDFYSQPLLHTAFGGMGGVIGAWIWRPPSSYLVMTGKRPGMPSAEFLAGVMAGQVSWFRVVAGVVIAVGGVIWADSILAFVLKASEGRMTVRNQLQQELMTYEIKALAIFFAGAISGTSTWNGGVQGLWVGMLSAALILGTQFGYHQSSVEVNTCILYASAVLILSTMGGAFGGKLLPPVARVGRRRTSPAPQ